MKATDNRGRSYVTVRNGYVARTVGSLVEGLCAELPSPERGSAVILTQTGVLTREKRVSALQSCPTAERNGLLDNVEYKNKRQNTAG